MMDEIIVILAKELPVAGAIIGVVLIMLRFYAGTIKAMEDKLERVERHVAQIYEHIVGRRLP